MHAHDATSIGAAVTLCVASACFDRGGTDLERESLGSLALAMEGIQPLVSVAVPRTAGIEIIDRQAAIALGKALFWDQQAGSDGKTACASCHFAAGADNRRFNIVDPGPNGVFEACGTTGRSQVTTPCNGTSDDRLGSQGVVSATFLAITNDPSSAADVCTAVERAPWGPARQVTARNTPSVVSAVFYRDLFWDGHARGLAAQAIESATSPVHMACAGRALNGANGLGEKLLARRPLQLQRVSKHDGVLGPLSALPNSGLVTTYRELIGLAFGASAAKDDALHRFSTYWGESIQAYEATLIPNQTPLDRYRAGNVAALSTNQVKGLHRFAGKAGCARCHAGAELSDATVSFAAKAGPRSDDGGDQGFHNTGVRPTSEDPGHGAGTFKTPSLRNVKLTAPYFHNGGKATLKEVVQFYDAGGDFPNPEKSRHIKRLGLDASDVDALVDFLTNALTDCRTEKERAPFDHPSLSMPDGATLPAVGAGGVGPCP